MPPIREIICVDVVRVPPNYVGAIELDRLEAQGIAEASVLVKVELDGQVLLRIANFALQTIGMPENKIIGSIVEA